jgi:hypothetical protein
MSGMYVCMSYKVWHIRTYCGKIKREFNVIGLWCGERNSMWLEEWWTWMWKDGKEEVDLRKDRLTVWQSMRDGWERWWAMSKKACCADSKYIETTAGRKRRKVCLICWPPPKRILSLTKVIAIKLSLYLEIYREMLTAYL